MSVTPKPPRNSPVVTQKSELSVQDTSLAFSDRSLRSMHSAPSLVSGASTSFASSVLSTSTLNLNVHSIPLRHPHLYIVDESTDQHEHDQQFNDNKENRHASFPPPPNITITDSPERPRLKRMESERTVAGSLRLPDPSQGGSDSDGHLSWRVSEYGVLSDPCEEEMASSDADSVSGSTDELRRTLFYRPSTDPIQVRFQPEDRELEAALSAGSTSNASLLQSDVPVGNRQHQPVLPELELQPEPKSSSPPVRPQRPPSLNLSDAQEHKPSLKTVDVDAVRRRSVQQAQPHSRRSSRDRLSMLLGINTASPRTSLQGGRPSFQAHNPSQSHSSNNTGNSQPASVGDAIWKGKERMVESSSPISETWVHVGAESAIELGRGMGVHSALELGNGRDIGASSAINLAASASGSRPRARTFSSHSRARTISSTHSQNAAEMCRSVWEDDETQELRRGWGLVRRWLGEDPSAGPSSTPGPKKGHAPKSLSLASTINAFRTPSTISSTINAFRAPTPMSPLFGEGGLMGRDVGNASFATAKESLSSALSGDDYATPGSVMTTHETGTSRLSFHSFSNTSKRTSRSGLPSAPVSNENGEGASSSLTVPAQYTVRPLSRASVQSSFDGHPAPEPESPTITAKKLRPRSGTLEVPEMPTKSSRNLFAESGSSLKLELKPGASKPVPRDFLRPGAHTAALPSPPSSPDDPLQDVQGSSFHPAATSTVRSRAPVPRSLSSTAFGSLHGRLGSPLRSATMGEEGWAPMSPFMSPHSSPQAAGPPSPGWSPISPLPSSPLRTPGSPLLSPGAGPASPLPLNMMDRTYRSDVRPMSEYTESSYWPSVSNRDSSNTGGTGWRRDSATARKRESDGTFAGQQSITYQPLLAPPPRTKTVRIVEAGPSTDRQMRAQPRPTFPPLPPSTPMSNPRPSSLFKSMPGSGAYIGSKMRLKRKEAVGAGPSARAWFMIGFILGPWCWVIGGWMVQQGRPMATLDIEKGGRGFEDAQWVKRCRIASIASGAVVFSAALVAVVWAAVGAR
ncbi:transmembrane protein [Rhizoctonia solani]|uniref:Transmembrane protein n=1 Tax=Rhizoctonia solani TaxID=456999 RepID=A0A8H8P631_9AGAM|nr:uncharacterized protein RhiXN_11007 [Rhizoctonia solani]QRW25930.1 transmembrane protein [Rhizoctonia solani]